MKCHYCGGKATTSDHVVPISLGGRGAKWNRVPACLSCNQSKANRMPDCDCNFCVGAVRLNALPREQQSATDQLQAWLNRYLPGQTV